MKYILILITFISLSTTAQINDDWDAVKVGITDMQKIYVGADLVWSKAIVTAPIVTTTEPTDVGVIEATIGGNVTSDGGGTVTTRGVCWNTTGSPTTANDKQAIGTGTGSFSAFVNSFTCGETYYLRAYATNSAGTSYGASYTIATGSANYLAIGYVSYISESTCLNGTYTFSSSLALAKQACDDYDLGCVTGAGGATFRAPSLSVGEQTYVYNGCSELTGSYYYVYPALSAVSPNRKILTIVSGVITAIEQY